MKRFPIDCTRNCPHLHCWDMSIDDWTNVCDLLERQIDDCDMNFMLLPICPLEEKEETENENQDAYENKNKIPQHKIL